ncbi:ABC-2 type transport system ATP-binding protein [Marininema mesophilum]|uniref:ABC-2 type transport system ATP-binding protein n=1 Tax=Marininema mesophilum TaxID=1048340 RepID=A0A1H2VPL5_9BACL|nr:ABC transporter ATP-binding protein [Marininema mesophilum]SDW70253.1 ABC-2 type transport system ATP-binding protein [Marininema mesophilum]
MIHLEQVSKHYLKKAALSDITLSLTPGTITGVIGENGSGKSTLLKLMAGLVRPTRGSVTFDGKPVTRRIASHVSYLSEQETYYPFYTVQETIDWQASQFPDFDHQIAEEILHFMNLDPEDPVKNLSKGNRARVKILLSLARKAPLILMDEPLSGLDPMVRDSIIKGLISFVDLEKQTLVITTHEVDEIESLLDHVIAIREGKIIQSISLEDLHLEEGVNLRQWMNQTYTSSTRS